MFAHKDTIYPLAIPTPYDVGEVQVYVLKGDRLTLIDAGVKTDEAWTALKNQLHELGYRPEDIEQVVLTHHHPDHMGLVENFPNVVTVAAHPKLRPWLERDEEYFTRYEKFFYGMYIESGVPEKYYHLLKGLRKPLKWTAEGKVTHLLTEGDAIPGHDEWKTIETPGHAQDHISFLRGTDGAFLAGDHLLEHISPNPLLEPPSAPGLERPRPLLQYRNSMQKLLDKKIGVVYPGHGNSFDKAHQLINQRLKKQEERAGKVLKLLKDKPRTAFEVCELIFPKHVGTQFGLTMSETIGQLDYLEHTQQVNVYFDENQKFYDVNG